MEGGTFYRIWGRTRRPEEGCWYFGNKRYGSQGGYCQILDGYDPETGKHRNRLVHRVVYETIHGKLPPCYEVMHLCDHPTCVRPDHLDAGTRSQNERAKDRRRVPEDRRRTHAAPH